jgi:hypothetical protein
MQQQQQQRAAEAQKQWENQRQANQDDQKKIMDQAQLAMWHQQMVIEQHNSDVMDQEMMDKRNESSRVLYNTYVAAGGKPPADPNVPSTIDAYDLSKKYVETKGQIAKAPDGYHRVFFDTTNGGEATRDPITGTWSEDGKPVDMTTKTTFRVLDVPEATMDVRVPHTGAEANKILGYHNFDDKATVMMSPNEATALITKNRQLQEERNANTRAQEEETAREYTAAYDTFKATETDLAGKLAELKAEANPDQNQINDLQTQQDQNLTDFRASRDKLYPSLKGKSISTPPADPIQKTVDTLKGKTPQEIQAALDDPKNGVPDSAKSEIWKRLGIAPPAPVAPPEPWGHHSTPAQDIQRGIQNAPTILPSDRAVVSF